MHSCKKGKFNDMTKQSQELGLSHQFEALKGTVTDLMQSKFRLLNERVKLQTKGISRFYPGLIERDDLSFRQSVESVLHSQLNRKGTFVLLNLATQHAVAVLDIFHKYGFDLNFLYFPIFRKPDKFGENGHGPSSSGRVMEVLSNPEHQARVTQSKNALSIGALNGVALNIHSHTTEKEKGELIKLFPTIKTLRQQGISNVLYMSEISPNAGVNLEIILHGSFTPEETHLARAATNLTPLQQYLKGLITNGFSLSSRGIDIRKRKDTKIDRFGSASFHGEKRIF